MVKQSLFAIVFLASSITAMSTATAETMPLDQQSANVMAEQDGRNWLALVDSQQYAASWQNAAAFFQQAIDQATWEQSLAQVREPLGELIGREVKASKFATELPGVADGQYMIYQFTTEYSNKANAIETLTLVLEDDGEWRVIGYYIN
ncbi:DUF4019 domain-containing protein [Paraferrimonas haliotis]|uniref:DUF4019 domain-containing protein n=1 Tax=Paraferrimonas haliotis TaxID=2013866 RepID=A0AA37WX59_9GAMM|nr:DUF4019 domain-containing protein [Paraferrimonas haliotis]GLS84288.1 hypothetical protein GCM10007894_22650 [Paraferrimonas haliotis]